jgi:DNA polymerase III epsilon subunit family exonuclease
VAVDIETTGLSNDDSIIEIAAVRFVGGQVEEAFCSLVRSKRVIPPKIERLTGITQTMISAAPHPEVVMREFVAFVSNHRLVFHNASFDMRFIGKYLEYYGHPLPDRILDTLPLARRKLPALSSHRLANLVQHLGLPVTPAHRAQDDCLATGHLYLALREIPSPRPKKKRKRPTVKSSKQSKATSAAHRDA